MIKQSLRSALAGALPLILATLPISRRNSGRPEKL